MSESFDVRRCATAFEQDRTLVAVIELSHASWLVGGMVPGLQRCPLKKLLPEKEELLALLLCHRTKLAAVLWK